MASPTVPLMDQPPTSALEPMDRWDRQLQSNFTGSLMMSRARVGGPAQPAGDMVGPTMTPDYYNVGLLSYVDFERLKQKVGRCIFDFLSERGRGSSPYVQCSTPHATAEAVVAATDSTTLSPEDVEKSVDSFAHLVMVSQRHAGMRQGGTPAAQTVRPMGLTPIDPNRGPIDHEVSFPLTEAPTSAPRQGAMNPITKPFHVSKNTICPKPSRTCRRSKTPQTTQSPQLTTSKKVDKPLTVKLSRCSAFSACSTSSYISASETDSGSTARSLKGPSAHHAP